MCHDKVISIFKVAPSILWVFFPFSVALLSMCVLGQNVTTLHWIRQNLTWAGSYSLVLCDWPSKIILCKWVPFERLLLLVAFFAAAATVAAAASESLFQGSIPALAAACSCCSCCCCCCCCRRRSSWCWWWDLETTMNTRSSRQPQYQYVKLPVAKHCGLSSLGRDDQSTTP